ISVTVTRLRAASLNHALWSSMPTTLMGNFLPVKWASTCGVENSASDLVGYILVIFALGGLTSIHREPTGGESENVSTQS
ncbi:hypothetical protein, partial [Rhodococcus jostii]|uniref:hypothetical protein n=1 Tax=Rhodococcus jostii TaxID=132919 RepID=UPI00363D8D25